MTAEKNLIIYNIDTETEKGFEKYNELMNPSSELFLELDKRFENWIETARQEEIDMYYSHDAIYEKSGAIRQVIEQIFEVMNMENLKFIKLNDNRLDILTVFSGG